MSLRPENFETTIEENDKIYNRHQLNKRHQNEEEFLCDSTEVSI